MPQRWKNILLPLSILLSATSLFFTSCKKQMSSDAPLPTNYYPSIIVNNDNQVIYAFDPTTGNKNWEYALYTPTNYLSLTPAVPIVFNPSPLVYNGSVYMAYSQHDPSRTDTIFKLNSRTGTLTKKIMPNVNEAFNIQATPIADGNLLYVATTNGRLFAIDTGTYATRWEFVANNNSPIISSPTIYNGNLYFATIDGTVYCIDKVLGPTGIANWTYQPQRQGDTAFFKNPADLATLVALRGNTNPTASFYSSPAIAAPYLYIGSVKDSNMYCILLTPPGTPTPTLGVERWRYKIKGGIYSSPATYAGTCIFGGADFHIYCLDTTINPTAPTSPTYSPQHRWIDSAHSSVFSSPYVYNQVVYIGSHDYILYAINIINGGIKWQFSSKGLIKSSPVAYNGSVYVCSYDKSIYALDTTNGKIKWSKDTNGQIEDSPVIDDLSGNSYNSGISGYCNGGINSTTANYFYKFNNNNF